ncbi:DEAD/DEAH box helicase [Spirosoma sp. KCTC 42546]|uniref:type I restriction endonuclease subunit R n=1 Tax=Spirosoma sp. KCTC 42546 TaxID=2520506 RepID=UPI00115959B5|nr:DEAD/DEAH box helicase family protein [Spirosoma sp. KCTC 42546]QDK80725.1 DEAD/DEAH box helicase [Spirosoma sp. KCTC 42546]
MTPEQIARQQIDRMLVDAGWLVQDVKTLNFSAGLGVAVREYPTDSGPADYLLFIDRKPVGVIEAKPEGAILTPVEEQSARYAVSKLKWQKDHQPLRFVYESTGAETHFTDNSDPAPRSRETFSFHRPETLRDWVKQGTSLRQRLQGFPDLDTLHLRDCQITAITNLEKSFGKNQPRALVQMATGSGKTFTAITATYRLLKYAKARRILFLVDTRNLGEQAEQEFQAFSPNDDPRKFNELYNVQRLRSSFVDPSAQVCISTIQRMYSSLRGEEIDETAEEESLNERVVTPVSREVVYNARIPIEAFDFVIIDECHRSIYNEWKQVLDYFDAFLIGLTATPDNRTFGFFNRNVVSEYTYERAVADGVNVPFDVYSIETHITKHGAVVKAGEWVDKRERQTRKKRWEQLDEEITYSGTALDRDVVNPDQIRTVVRTFHDKLPEIFPHRAEVPKTLIFAKSDFHADDIIKTVREVFGEGNEFCRKVTYSVGKNGGEKPSEVLQQFRTAYYPRIAVTVDMIATGTDVKAIECLLFMRDVKSRSYFEQMKGRGTRTMPGDDLRKVTPSAVGNKTHFVLVDAVGVSKSLKTDSRPLERKPGVSLKNLLWNVAVGGDTSEDTLTSLANRLTRLEKQLSPAERNQLTAAAGGKTINRVVNELLDAYNPDKLEERARLLLEVTGEAVTPAILDDAREELIREAIAVFDDPNYRNLIESIRRDHDQLIDGVNLDTVISVGWDASMAEKAGTIVTDFKVYLYEHRDEITALQIFYNQPNRRRELTYRMIQEVGEKLKTDRPDLSPFTVWKAYEVLDKVNGSQPKHELIALVSLIRRVLEIDTVLTSYDQAVNRNFQNWVFRQQAGALKFTEEQIEWLRMMKDTIARSIHLDRDDFDLSPFVEHGGLGKLWNLFGDRTFPLIDELNEQLAA